MSTYTDLQNKVKETLNVDYHNRMTNQKAIFMNPENVYYGKFKGKIDVTNSSLAGGTISGVTIMSAILSNDIILPGNVDLAKIGSNISYLSTTIDSNLEHCDQQNAEVVNKIAKEVYNRKLANVVLSGQIVEAKIIISGDVKSEATTRKYHDTFLSNAITSLQDQTEEKLELSVENLQAEDSRLDQRISNQNECMLSNDERLSTRIEQESFRLNSETNARILADNNLDDKIETVSYESQRRYDDAIQQLEEHDAKNDAQFDELSGATTQEIEHRKHYKIVQDGITTKYPYQLEEYAVNIVRTDLATGFAVRNGKTIGKIEHSTSAEYPMTLEIFDFDDADLKIALKPSTFTFDEGHQSYETGCNNYTIQYVPGATSFESGKFNLIPVLGNYLNVYYNNGVIGEIRNYKRSHNEIISGFITINSSTEELAPLNRFKNVEFNGTTLSSATRDNCRMEFNGIREFKFLKNLTTIKYCPLVDISGNAFGCIYENGIVSSSTLQKITAHLTDPAIKDVDMCLSNNFVGEVNENTVMSCNIANYKFDVVECHELYKYGFYISDDLSCQHGRMGYVVPNVENKDISTFQFSTISADISAVIKIPAFAKTYALQYSASADRWSASDATSDGDSIDIWFDRQFLYFFAINGRTGTNISGKYRVAFEDKTISNPDTCHRHLHTTNPMSLVFDQTEERYEKRYDTFATLEDKHDDYKTYELQISKNSENSVKFQIPNKTFSDISRQFSLVARIDSIRANSAKLEFVDHNNVPVTIFNNGKPNVVIDTNKYVTFQLQEIQHGIYLIVDNDLNEVRQAIEQLRSEVAVVSSELSTSIQDLSTSLSNEISTRYDALDSKINATNELLLATSAALSNDVKLSVAALEDKISANYNRISDLRSETIELSNALTQRIDDTQLSIAGISSIIDNLSIDVYDIVEDISSSLTCQISTTSSAICLSVEQLEDKVDQICCGISTDLSSQMFHYDRTFQKDVFVDVRGQEDIKIDTLVMTEEDMSGKKYTLHLSAGMLVLMPQN